MNEGIREEGVGFIYVKIGGIGLEEFVDEEVIILLIV